MMNLTEAQRILLTAMIGECVHEFGRDSEGYEAPCVKCGLYQCKASNYTFTTGNDMLLVKAAIEKAGKWEEFSSFCISKYYTQMIDGQKGFTPWLIDNLCLLAAEWAETLEERWWV